MNAAKIQQQLDNVTWRLEQAEQQGDASEAEELRQQQRALERRLNKAMESRR